MYQELKHLIKHGTILTSNNENKYEMYHYLKIMFVLTVVKLFIYSLMQNVMCQNKASLIII